MHAESRVSAICTVRNEARHVRHALSSVLVPQVAEVIVVDDGSSDATLDVLREMTGADRRVRLITSPPRGRGPALKRAIREARGEFIVNVDADDVLHPEWIACGVALLTADPSLVVVAARPRFIAKDETVEWRELARRPEVQDVTSQLVFHNPLVHSSAIMKRNAIERLGGYDVTRRSQFDYDLWLRVAEAGWKIGVVNMPFVGKRLHDGQKFERRHRLSYLGRGASVQARAIRVLDAGRSAWVFLAMRLGWGLLPHALRMLIRRSWL